MTKTTNNPVTEALKLFYASTGTFTFWSLAGPRNAALRQKILATLTQATVHRSEAGVNAVEKAFYAVANPLGDCAAAREAAFRVWARKQIGLEIKDAAKVRPMRDNSNGQEGKQS